MDVDRGILRTAVGPVTEWGDVVAGDPVTDDRLSWYFPRNWIYRVARRRDRDPGRRHGHRGKYLKALARIEAGGRDDYDLMLLNGLQANVWAWLVGVSFVPTVVEIVLAAILGGLGDYLWVVGVTGAIPVGLLSLGFVFYLRTVAITQNAQDPDDPSFVTQHFMIPKRVDLLVIAVFYVGFLTIFGANTNWFH